MFTIMRTPITEEQRTMVAQNLKLAHSFFNRNRQRVPEHAQDDFEQEVAIGLCRAVRFHNPEREACPQWRNF